MAKRYELPDAAWDLVVDIFSEPRRSGRSRADDRLMLNGVLWGLCSGAAWRDIHIRLNEQGLIDLETWMIDSTAVRATRASSGAGKKGGPKNRKTMPTDEAGEA